MKDSPQPIKLRRYDAVFRAEVLRLVGESRSIQAAARALNIDPKRLYKWQKEALPPWRQPAGRSWTRLRPTNCASCEPPRRQAQELDILKKAITIFSQTPDQ